MRGDRATPTMVHAKRRQSERQKKKRNEKRKASTDEPRECANYRQHDDVLAPSCASTPPPPPLGSTRISAKKRTLSPDQLSTGKKRKSSSFIGVSRRKKTGYWTARISMSGQEKLLGKFDNEVDAARAYDDAVIMNKLGRKTNFPRNDYIEEENASSASIALSLINSARDYH